MHNLARILCRFIENICAPLTSHLLDLIDDISKSSLPDKLILALLDIVNMFPNIDSERGLGAECSLLDASSSNNPSTECIMEGLEIYLFKDNSRFVYIHLLQTDGTATRAPDSCSYSNIAISHLDKIINEKSSSQIQECFYFSKYHDEFLVLYCGDIEKINDFHKMLNTLDEKLKFMMDMEVVVFVF